MSLHASVPLGLSLGLSVPYRFPGLSQIRLNSAALNF